MSGNPGFYGAFYQSLIMEELIQVNSGNIGPVQWGVAAAQNRAEWLSIKTPETAVICQESQEYFVSTAANLVNVV